EAVAQCQLQFVLALGHAQRASAEATQRLITAQTKAVALRMAGEGGGEGVPGVAGAAIVELVGTAADLEVGTADQSQVVADQPLDAGRYGGGAGTEVVGGERLRAQAITHPPALDQQGADPVGLPVGDADPAQFALLALVLMDM